MKQSALIILFIHFGCKTISIHNGFDSLTGLWKLVTVEKKDSSGRWIEDQWMKNGTGYIIYDGKGHMAVQMVPKGYMNFEWLSERENTNAVRVRSKLDSLSIEELKILIEKFSSHQAYFAN